MNTFQTVQRVTFTSAATVLIPLGVGLVSTQPVVGICSIALGILALVLREVFKVVEN